MTIALAWIDASDPTDRAIAFGLARELERLGREVLLVGPRRRAGEPFSEVVDGFPVLRVGPSQGLAVRQLLRIHREKAVDVWHCHVFGRSHQAFARAARLGRFRVLASLHLVLKDYLPFLGGREGLKRLLAQAFHVALPDEAARREFLSFFPGWRAKTSVVRYGIAAPGPAAARPHRVRAPYILSVARLAPYKGPDLLLMAFADVAEARPGLNLVLCGRDQLHGGVERFIRALGLEGRVTLTGELVPSAVARLLKDCEFAVLPSRRENSPLAALEAMAAGKAVVASAVGGVPELIRDGVSGFLVPPGDVAALARRLGELADAPALRRRLGSAALKASRSYTWRRAAAAYGRLYR